MAEEKPEGKEKKGKKGKKGNGQKVAIALGGSLAVYLGYRYYENYKANQAAGATSASPAAATPDTSTGSLGSSTPDATGDTSGSAIDPTTGDYYTNESPFSSVDPNSPTGETFGQEVDDLESQIGVDNTNWADLEQYLTAQGGKVSTGTGGTTDTQTQAESRAALTADVAKATGLTPAEAGQQVALYLEGKPLTNKGAVNSITNQVNANLAPTTFGTTTLPTPTLAKGATSSTNDAAAVAAQKKAASVVTADKGTAAETQALTNEKRAAATVAARQK
jgi:hypothetical protein